MANGRLKILLPLVGVIVLGAGIVASYAITKKTTNDTVVALAKTDHTVEKNRDKSDTNAANIQAHKAAQDEMNSRILERFEQMDSAQQARHDDYKEEFKELRRIIRESRDSG